MVNVYDYDSYGRVSAELEAITQPFRYTAREWDAATELYHYRARQYDPTTGRFLREDPIGFAAGDLNVYRYVGSNPLRFTDPYGMSASAEKSAVNGVGMSSISAMAQTGARVNCLFTALAAAVTVAHSEFETAELINAGTNVAMECGVRAKVKKPKPKKSNCKAKCFAAGTLVHTRQGLKRIEDIVAGDEVKSMNVQTGEIAYKSVIHTHINKFDPVGEVAFRDSKSGSITSLLVTKNHPFFSVTRGWVHASNLVVGENLLEDDGGTLVVERVAFNSNAPINVTYNLEVAEFHTYFVGDAGVLVHNGNNKPYNFGALRQAYMEACAKIGGCKGLPKSLGKWGSDQRGDSKCGIRLDPPHPPHEGGKDHSFWHINFWDYRNGKRKAGGITGAVKIIIKE